MIDRRRLLLPGTLLVAAAVLIGVLVTVAGEATFDDRLVRAARGWRGGTFGDLLLAITRVGYGTYLVPAAVVIATVLAAAPRRTDDALVVLLATPVTVVATRALKETFQRVRPEGGIGILDAGFSMPSGHAASSAAFATALIVVLPRGHAWDLLRGALVVLTALNVLSRVVLGVHWPSDVVAGSCLGVGIALLVAVAVDRALARVQRPSDG